MTKILIGMLSLALVGVGGLVAAVDGFGEDRPVRSVSIPAGTTTGGAGTGTTSEPDDNVPASAVTTTGTTTTGTTTGGADDISGPCDEPEHANDPRYTGVGTSTNADDGDDSSGSGDHGDSSGSDDRSGHEDGDDSSGSGSDDD